MDKKERINAAFVYLKRNGVIKKQKDLAAALKSTPANVSYALSGNEKYLTDNFIVRFSIAFKHIFNIEWIIDGTGEMLRNEESSSNIINITQNKSSNGSVSGNNNIVGARANLEKENELLKQQIADLRKMVETLTNIINNSKT